MSTGAVGTPRRCRAYHRLYGVRCEGVASFLTGHTEEHWAVVKGAVVYWDDDIAAPEEQYLADSASVGNGSARDAQIGGEHYKKFKIQPWDVVDEYGLSFYAGNALKYLLRAGNKGAAIEDLRKCRHYLDKLIETYEEDSRDVSE